MNEPEGLKYLIVETGAIVLGGGLISLCALIWNLSLIRRDLKPFIKETNEKLALHTQQFEIHDQAWTLKLGKIFDSKRIALSDLEFPFKGSRGHEN